LGAGLAAPTSPHRSPHVQVAEALKEAPSLEELRAEVLREREQYLVWRKRGSADKRAVGAP